MLQKVTNDMIKELASIYDVQDTFVSLYLNVTRGVDWKYIAFREKQIYSVLKTDKYLLESFIENIDEIKKMMKKEMNEDIAREHFNGIAIFFSKKMNFFMAIGFPHEIKNSMIVDTSPYIRPLVQLVDEWENYALILIDTNQAKLFLVSLGGVKDRKRLVANIMNKHKKGGWSQMRFQRLRQEAIEHFQKTVIEALDKFVIDEKIVGIVLAGPGETKIQFKRALPQVLAEYIMAELDYPMDLPPQKLVEAATLEVAKKEREKSAEAVELLKNEILKGGLAVYGINETVNATRDGKAELLILSKELKPRGWICEHCQVVEVGSKKVCPICNNKTSEVDVLEEILEFAERTGTNIEFVDDNPILEELGGVGALLRYL
jgi:peptide chain release factor subunit 1